jgi:DNA-binding CsgD family transcriptional regulator
MIKNKTIGFIIDRMSSPKTLEMSQEGLRFFNERQMRCVFYDLCSFEQEGFQERISERILNSIENEPLDGIILLGDAVFPLAKPGFLETLVKAWACVPIVTIDILVPPIPTILNDEKAGMRLLLDHLLHEHGIKSFSFVKEKWPGPSSSERWIAFQEYITQQGLDLSPNEVVETIPDSIESGQGEKAFIVSTNASAVICHNRHSEKPTHIAPQYIDICRLACERLMASLEGMPGQLVRHVQPKLMISEHCGCVSSRDAGTLDSLTSQKKEKSIDFSIENTPNPELHSVLQAYLAGFKHRRWFISYTVSDQHNSKRNILGFPLQKDENRLSSSLLPHSWIEEKTTASYIVQPLWLGTNQVGHVAMDIVPNRMAETESLSKGMIDYLAVETRKAGRVLGSAGPSILRREGLHDEKPDEDIIQQLPIWILELDRNYKIRFANLAALRLLGLSKAECILKDYLSIVSPAYRESMKNALDFCLGDFSTTCADFCFATQSGSKVPAIGHIQNIMTPAGAQRIRLSGLELKPVMRDLFQPKSAFYQRFHFSIREKEIINAMIQGLDIKEMSKKFNLSANTVKGYMHLVYIKTGADGRKDFFKILRAYQPGRISTLSLGLFSSTFDDPM